PPQISLRNLRKLDCAGEPRRATASAVHPSRAAQERGRLRMTEFGSSLVGARHASPLQNGPGCGVEWDDPAAQRPARRRDIAFEEFPLAGGAQELTPLRNRLAAQQRG